MKIYVQDKTNREKTYKPRPIAVTFATLGYKIKVMQQKRALNDTGHYLKDDYPNHILEKRKMLQEQIKIEQEKINKASIKYDKLVLKPNKTDADHTHNKKRYLSISPQQEKNAEKNTPSTSTQAAKKNKIVQSRTTPQQFSII